MTSAIANIAKGAAKVTWNVTEYGWTKGGVTVKTDQKSKPITLDQFGETEMDKILTGKSIEITVPMAETAILASLPLMSPDLTVSSTHVDITMGVGTSMYGMSQALTIERMTDEDSVEAGNTPMKYYFYKACPDMNWEDKYQAGEQVIVNVKFIVFPYNDGGTWKWGYRGKV